MIRIRAVIVSPSGSPALSWRLLRIFLDHAKMTHLFCAIYLLFYVLPGVSPVILFTSCPSPRRFISAIGRTLPVEIELRCRSFVSNRPPRISYGVFWWCVLVFGVGWGGWVGPGMLLVLLRLCRLLRGRLSSGPFPLFASQPSALRLFIRVVAAFRSFMGLTPGCISRQ